MKLENVTERLGEEAVSELLALAVGTPTPDSLAAVAREYVEDSSMVAFALMSSDGAVGLAGLELLDRSRARLRYIAVRPGSRGAGLGRRLLEEVLERHEIQELVAESHFASRSQR